MKEKNLKILWVSAQHTFEIAFASGARRNGEKKNEDAFELLASFSVNKLLMDSGCLYLKCNRFLIIVLRGQISNCH